MSVIRIKKARQKPYVILDTTALNDARLSFRAKGLHTYLMAKPDDWQGSIEALVQESHEGRKAIRSAIEELEELGYACLKRNRGMSGHLRGWDLVVCDTPELSREEKSDESERLEEHIGYLKSLIPHSQPISGYIYVLQSGPYFKIGKAVVADKRIAQLPIQLPFKVKVRHLVGCERYIEAEDFFHRRYDAKRTNGEWFALDEQELQELEAIRYLPATGMGG